MNIVWKEKVIEVTVVGSITDQKKKESVIRSQSFVVAAMTLIVFGKEKVVFNEGVCRGGDDVDDSGSGEGCNDDDDDDDGREGGNGCDSCWCGGPDV